MKQKLLQLAALLSIIVSLGGSAYANEGSVSDQQITNFINKIATTAIGLINVKEDSSLERRKSLETLIGKDGAVKETGRFVLGQYARQLKNYSKQEEYYELGKRFAAKTMYQYLKIIPEIKVKINRIIVKGKRKNQYIAFSVVTIPGTETSFKIDWWLIDRAKQGQPADLKLFDFSFEGIWIAQSQRSTFISLLRKSRGDFDKLLKYMSNVVNKSSDDDIEDVSKISEQFNK